MPKIADQLERLNANIEVLVEEMREQRRRADTSGAREPAAPEEERGS